MYSSYEYTLYDDQAGNYSKEGDVYNREHSWPQSFFNEASPMKTDLFHIYPTDGYVNGVRSNYPYGETDVPNYTSTNGSKRGYARSGLGYSGIVFEPIDEYKGDFARTYFYMSTRYYGEDGNWDNWPMADGVELKDWAVDMLLVWHRNDSVSTKEINRNDAVYALQNNRNPFIDNPEYVEYIWGDKLPVPVAEVATQIDSTSFRANWTSVAAATAYKLYVSEDAAFTTYLDAYDPGILTANYALISGLAATHDYYYRVKAVDGDRESDLSNTIHVTTTSAHTAVADIPATYVIGPAYPNPFNPDCVLPLRLDRDIYMDISLLDISGKMQKEIFSGVMSAGDHKLILKAAELNAGLYIVRVLTPQHMHAQKVLFLK
jgi:endonuclease I